MKNKTKCSSIGTMLLIVSTLFIFAHVQAQDLPVPPLSPLQKIEQKIGMSTVSIEYCRPSKRGRTIFGELVHYDKVWRLGANLNTKITFDTKVTMGGKEIEAGTYALFAKPGKDMWKLYLYSDATNWGTPQKWDEAKVLATVSGKPFIMQGSIVETFTIMFEDLQTNAASIGVLWDNLYIGFPFQVPTDDIVAEKIKAFEQGPSVYQYMNIANYYAQDGVNNYAEAIKWIDKSVMKGKETNFKYVYYLQSTQAKIYHKAGKPARAIAKEALKGAEKIKAGDEFIEKLKTTMKKYK